MFTGPRRDVERLYAAADLFALPSLHEGCPVAILEALASGLPVVTSRATGAPELLPGPLAELLVDDPRDADAVAARLASRARSRAPPDARRRRARRRLRQRARGRRRPPRSVVPLRGLGYGARRCLSRPTPSATAPRVPTLRAVDALLTAPGTRVLKDGSRATVAAVETAGGRTRA